MNVEELVKRKEEIQTKITESNLAEKCVKIATKLGEDRGSFQRDCYTNTNYLYNETGLSIDCDIGQNMQGSGELIVKNLGKIVFHISNSYPYALREDLPKVTAKYVPHRVIVYEPGSWENRIKVLASF
jgi:hypothetical protein